MLGEMLVDSMGDMLEELLWDILREDKYWKRC